MDSELSMEPPIDLGQPPDPGSFEVVAARASKLSVQLGEFPRSLDFAKPPSLFLPLTSFKLSFTLG